MSANHSKAAAFLQRRAKRSPQAAKRDAASLNRRLLDIEHGANLRAWQQDPGRADAYSPHGPLDVPPRAWRALRRRPSAEFEMLARAEPRFQTALNALTEPKLVDALCKGQVDADYVRRNARFVDLVLMRKRRGSVEAFALVEKPSDGRWHVLVICARAGGAELMRQLVTAAQRSGVQRVTLDALPHVINFYRNLFGFQLSTACREARDVKASADAQREKRFRARAEALNDPEFVALLERLVAAQLAANKRCRKASTCSIDGYRMTLCLAPRSQAA